MGDFLYELTDKLRGTALVDFSLAVSEWPFSQWVVSQFWAIPILQMVHIFAIAGSFAAVLMLNLRIFHLAGHASLAETAARYTKVLWWSLGFVILSGVLMLFGDTVRNLINSVFWIKMILVVLGIVTAIAFANNLGRQYRTTTGDTEIVGGGVKVTAIFLALLWCAIMFAGRWIAYAPA